MGILGNLKDWAKKGASEFIESTNTKIVYPLKKD